MTGGSGGGVDFNTRSKENRTKDIAMWLVDDDEAAEIERKEAEMAAIEATQPEKKGRKKAAAKKKDVGGSLEDLYHEGLSPSILILNPTSHTFSFNYVHSRSKL